MWLRDPKRPESRATLGLGRSYTQQDAAGRTSYSLFAPSSQESLKAAPVDGCAPCFAAIRAKDGWHA